MKLAIKDEGDVKEKGEDLMKREEESRIWIEGGWAGRERRKTEMMRIRLDRVSEMRVL